MDNTPSHDDVVKAMDKFDEGDKPKGFGEAKRWFVRNPKNGDLYPAKMIWGIASGEEVHPTTVRKKLETLGFRLHDKRQESDFQKQASDFQEDVTNSKMDTETDRCLRLENATKRPKYSECYITYSLDRGSKCQTQGVLGAFDRVADGRDGNDGQPSRVGRFFICNQRPRFLTDGSAKADFATTQCTQIQCSRLDLPSLERAD